MWPDGVGIYKLFELNLTRSKSMANTYTKKYIKTLTLYNNYLRKLTYCLLKVSCILVKCKNFK